MQIVLFNDGTVRWNFIRNDGPIFGYDLFSGIYLGHDRQTLHEIARGTIPVGETWFFKNVQFSEDGNANGIPDECEPQISTADTDDNGIVDVVDLLTLLAAWGQCAPPCPGDIDGNGVVDIVDLLSLLAAWGANS